MMVKRFASLLVGALMLSACGGLTYEIHGTPKAPEADVRVDADVETSASMTRLKVTIEHLAPAGRLAKGAQNYVAWARKAEGSPWQRIGTLEYSEGSREGKLNEVTVPFTSFELMVSAEKGASPEVPSADIIVTQRVN